MEGDQASQFDMALKWAKSVEGRPAAMLLWNGDHNSDELCEKLDEMRIYVGIPNFKIFVDDDDKGIELRSESIFDDVELPKGVDFEVAINEYRAAERAAQYMAKKLDGKKGSVVTAARIYCSRANYVIDGFEDEFKELKEKGDYDLSQVKIPINLVYEENMISKVASGCDDIIGMYVPAPDFAYEWIEHMHESGKNPDDVVNISADMSEEMVKLFENGDLDMLIGRSLYREGYKCAENFDKLFKGEKVPKFEYIDAEYLTEETAGELLPRYKELFERTKDEEFFERYEAMEFIAEQ